MAEQPQPEINPTTQQPEALEPLPQQEEFWRPPARFGSVPIEAEPLGWDRQRGFQKHYPRVDLPTQIVERVRLGNDEPHEPNRLIWGDNLHIMRQLPSRSIDLIYIDPPFFSGRQYNVMWGDANEMRSFNDIWEDGMPGYLIWLNARLYEMKRLLKPTGSIYVHCDWHASHYIKVEMDKVFGHYNFRNEIIWRIGWVSGFKTRKRGWIRNHETLLYYVASNLGVSRFNKEYLPYPEGYVRRDGKAPTGRGIPLEDTWNCSSADILDSEMIKSFSTEKIGYPTQKPEALLQRVIKASSTEGEVVADFFIGGGTTAAAAQALCRRFIGCDQSRVAIAVTAERLKQQAMTRGIEDEPIPDFTVEHWGVYEAERLSAMSSGEFRKFVLQAYGATRIGDDDDPGISGWRNQRPIWVGESDLDYRASADDVRDFANAIGRTVQYRDANLRDGVMLAWGFREDAREAADALRQREHVDVNFVRLSQIRIGDADFREHIVGRSTERADYSEFLTFVQPPVVSVAYRANGGRAVTFDAGDSAVVNQGAEIVNVQWDFNHDGRRFTATPGYSFKRGKDKKPQLSVTHKFDRTGAFQVACRLQDSRGGEGTWTGKVTVR